jgi:peptidoglycan hydrolase CwlO-like protein
MIEITSYVLGMLTIAAALLLIALVAGMVKINKTNKQLLQIEKQIDEIYHMTSHEHDHFQQQLERTCRDINMVEKTVMNQIEKVDRDHCSIEDEIHREIDQTKSYIDSRIDKVVLQGSIIGKKEIIKG